MIRFRILLFTLIALLVPVRQASAEVALLIHGYLSNAATWEFSGVNAALRQAGWQYAGNFTFSPTGLLQLPAPHDDESKKQFYTIDLPSIAPAPLQASWLKAAVDAISRAHPDENITLVGHSAGGVVARLMLVQYGNKRVFDLVKDFGTSESPKSTRSSTTHWCPGRPGHPAFRHNIASSLRLHTGLPYDWTPRSDAPLGSPLAPSARRVSRVASRLPGTTRLRFALHGGQRGKVDRLITIAAPHLGTDKAIRALDAVDDDGMFGFIKEWFVKREIGNGLYRTLKVSRGILFNLVPPAPGTLLYWLNIQPHPDIEYISIVRSAGYVIAGDLVVPPFSQDMNQVPALRGKSKVYITYQGHELTPADGVLLARIL